MTDILDVNNEVQNHNKLELILSGWSSSQFEIYLGIETYTSTLIYLPKEETFITGFNERLEPILAYII